MPVKIHPELQALRAAAKAPRDGYFSVLDELIGQLPDRPISVEELRQRLKPGRILKREDMKFPLKQEELDYALPELGQWSDGLKQDPKNLRDFVRRRRPAFTMDDVHNEGEHAQYGTQGPNRPPSNVPRDSGEDYFATTTDSPDFGKHRQHYNDETISFSRGSRHSFPGGGGILRVIDEIQNDRANDARKHAHVFNEDREDGPFVEGPIRGWRTPDQQAELDQVARDHPDVHDFPGWNDDVSGQSVPDAPFKTPQEYGRLEIKNQLLDAIAAGDDALGITPASGPASWFPQTGAKDTTYDKVYPGELRKIAKQYGAEFRDMPLPVKTNDGLSLPSLAGTDIMDFVRTTDWDRGEPLTAYQKVIDDMYTKDRARLPHNFDPRSGHRTRVDEAQEQLDIVRDMEAEGDPDLQDAREMLGDMLRDAYDDLIEKSSSAEYGRAIRNIPSMHLTPEVKERIARIGLPLFTAAGAASLLPEMSQESDMGALDQTQGFAKGGMVGRTTGALRGIREASARAAAGRGQEREWLRGLTAHGEPRGPAGGAAHGDAGEYGAWSEGPAKAPREPAQNFVERSPAPRRDGMQPKLDLRRRANDAQSLAQGYNRFADAMDENPRQRQYFVDANKLKALNDNYGFSVGDRLIELQNQLLHDEISGLDPSVGAIMARGPGDEVFLAGNDDAVMREAINRANNRLITEGVHMDTPQGKRTISGVASLKYGAGDDLEAAERDLMARKNSGLDDRADASEAIEVLEAPRYRAQGGSLNTMRTHLNNYAAGGGVSLMDQYHNAFEGNFEDGDEFVGEDDQFEYYACGGAVHGYSLGGKLKKAVKKVSKVANLPAKVLSKVPGVKSIANVVAKAAPALGFIPGVGTVAGGLIGGVAGNIASGGKTSGFLKGALAGASGGISGGIAKGVAGKLGTGLLSKAAGSVAGDLSTSLMQGAMAKLSNDPSGKSLSPDERMAMTQNKGIIGSMVPGSPGAGGMNIPSPIDIGALRQNAVATNAAAPTQLSMLQASNQMQPRVQPGANANGLLARIQQQQAMQPQIS